jgi:hypothetical protein
MRGYPRREFVLRALAACGTTFFVPTTVDAASRSSQAGADAGQDAQGAQAAAEYFGGRSDAVGTVGTAYLRQFGLEPTRASIRQAARGTIRTIARASSQEKAIAALVRDVQRDFREERSVQVEGWILSRTEVELCILTLLPPDGRV